MILCSPQNGTHKMQPPEEFMGLFRNCYKGQSPRIAEGGRSLNCRSQKFSGQYTLRQWPWKRHLLHLWRQQYISKTPTFLAKQSFMHLKLQNGPSHHFNVSRAIRLVTFKLPNLQPHWHSFRFESLHQKGQQKISFTHQKLLSQNAYCHSLEDKASTSVIKRVAGMYLKHHVSLFFRCYQKKTFDFTSYELSTARHC